MKSGVPGFTLLEWVIYFFLTIVVVTLMFEYVVGVRRHVVGITQQASTLAQLSAAHDACVRDVSAAAERQGQWRVVGPSSLVWQKGTMQCSWSVEEGALVRRERLFDAVKKEWKPVHKSVVARGNIVLHVVPLYAQTTSAHQEQRLVGLEILLAGEERGKKISVHSTIAFKNGIV